MKHIYDMSQLLKQMTIDDLLVRHDVTHAEYRNWLASNKLPLYAITRGLYEEALLSDDPMREYRLTRSDTHKIMYSSGWTEPRKCKTSDIVELLKIEPHLCQEYIATKLDVTQARVSQVARKYDLRPQRKRRNDVSREAVLKLKGQEYEAPEIARKLDISLSNVYKKMSACKNT